MSKLYCNYCNITQNSGESDRRFLEAHNIPGTVVRMDGKKTMQIGGHCVIDIQVEAVLRAMNKVRK